MIDQCHTRSARQHGCRLLALFGAAVLVLASDLRPAPPPHDPAVVPGPLATLLASSTDLGPSRAGDAQVTVTLRDSARPEALTAWARGHGLWLRWHHGDSWAIVEGPAAHVQSGFDVPVRDYRGRMGQVFYASAEQPRIPAALTGVVTGLGRVLGYTPHHMAVPDNLPADVPSQGLSPDGLLLTYGAAPLYNAGFTGQGATIVFFEFDGFDQRDLDLYSQMSGLPQVTPVVVGGMPGPSRGETVMDLEVAHAIAPDARLVVVNARPTVEGDGGYEKIGQMFADADRRFPGAVWSLSIGWGCDRLITAADLAPLRSALAAAQARGTTAFTASGDAGGLECKGGDDWATPPGPSDIGLNSVASLPEMTSVGGTTLFTDERGQWVAEKAWVDSPMSQGSSGGVSALFERPSWQNGVSTPRDSAHRLTPDVAAVADPFTGVRIVYNQQTRIGAGTSQSAPIWAGLTVLMNQYLNANGGKTIGNLNPLLYEVAAGAKRPGFRDVPSGGNAVDLAAPGYDLVTGLGTPNTYNLAQNLLDIQQGAARR